MILSASPQHALELLRAMLGNHADFRPGQWDAIESVAIHKKRALVVQRTGWGKSLVYFIATKLLRDQGAGPTLLISPLLSLMRNQIEMASRIGIRAHTIHSANQEEWDLVEMSLKENTCDILLISPERLNNERFLQSVLPGMAGRIGLFVVDEAHCISDWGHDFRPDYRRITRILNMLPKSAPVLGTTATANNRVVADVRSQLGVDLLVLRGTLTRESLRLQNITLANQSERLAWLVENLPKLPGSGIVYCLTVPDTERVTGWLKQKGFSAEAYYADAQDRPALEQAFLNNEVKILVATVALGMGFDKPDIGFVVHFQRPGSVIAYYQQVGRAGRAVERSYGILLSGMEDDEIQDYFIQSAFPSVETMNQILSALAKTNGLAINEILARVNISKSMLDKALRLLEVDGAVGTAYEHRKTIYFRTPNPWQADIERIEHVTQQRRAEQAQMQEYMAHTGCLMEFLQRALDDTHLQPCGRCANCRGKGLPKTVSYEVIVEAEAYLKGISISIEPRHMLPAGIFPDHKRKVPPELLNETGRSLCYYGDAGWGTLVRSGKYEQNHFSDELVEAAARLIGEWKPEPFPVWMTAIPSRRHPELVRRFAERLSTRIGIPFKPVLIRISDAPQQKTMQNSSMQAINVFNTLDVSGEMPNAPVLLMDDILDSGWTLTMAGWLLRSHGCGQVFPFTLAQATAKNS
ncbi:MAG: RecQ family ATP-dependent DNA helicase [Chloroflexi bacterium]|nr:RecQ family ATP-dependent DNA helicase [Chloroflexota bacterium]